MQAMALQIAYDNVQLALFRPFMSEKKCFLPLTRSESPGLAPRNAQPTGIRDILGPGDRTISDVAFQQCFTSAIRTSMIGCKGTLPILRSMQDSPINIHLGVHAFAAGVALGLLALQNPVSPVGQDCKRGIARLIQASKGAGLTAHVWTQAADVLTDLLRVVASTEVDALLNEGAEKSTGDRTVCASAFGAPADSSTEDNWGAREGPGHADASVRGTMAQKSTDEDVVDTGDTETTIQGRGCTSNLQVSPRTSGDGAGMQPDLSPFSEFIAENYTLYNYGQAWMAGDISDLLSAVEYN